MPWIDPRPDLLQSSGHPSRSAPRVALALAAVIALIVLLGAAVRRRRRRPPQID